MAAYSTGSRLGTLMAINRAVVKEEALPIAKGSHTIIAVIIGSLRKFSYSSREFQVSAEVDVVTADSRANFMLGLAA